MALSLILICSSAEALSQSYGTVSVKTLTESLNASDPQVNINIGRAYIIKDANRVSYVNYNRTAANDINSDELNCLNEQVLNYKKGISDEAVTFLKGKGIKKIELNFTMTTAGTADFDSMVNKEFVESFSNFELKDDKMKLTFYRGATFERKTNVCAPISTESLKKHLDSMMSFDKLVKGVVNSLNSLNAGLPQTDPSAATSTQGVKPTLAAAITAAQLATNPVVGTTFIRADE